MKEILGCIAILAVMVVCGVIHTMRENPYTDFRDAFNAEFDDSANME